MSEDAASNVVGMQDGRQAEGRQAHQAATASEATRTGQCHDFLTGRLCTRCTVAMFPSQY